MGNFWLWTRRDHGRQSSRLVWFLTVVLALPVAGIPIQVTRTYDSRDKRAGDFGAGWTLDHKSINVVPYVFAFELLEFAPPHGRTRHVARDPGHGL